MKNIDIPPFFVGQEVVAVNDHNADYPSLYKKGDEFIVVETVKTRCCKRWCIYVGVGTPPGRTPGTYCNTCHKANAHPTKLVFPAKDFAPKHNYGEFISMKEFADKQLETIGAH